MNYSYLRRFREIGRDCLAAQQSSLLNELLGQWRELRARVDEWVDALKLSAPLTGLTETMASVRAPLLTAVETARIEVGEIKEQINMVVAEERQVMLELDRIKHEHDNFPTWWAANADTFIKDVHGHELKSLLQRLNQDLPLEQLEQLKEQLQGTAAKWTKQEQFQKRFGTLADEWMERLERRETATHNDLRRLYVKHANVIGTTCSQTANGQFLGEYGTFDVVIVDEVSKATPPELLLPLLVGRRCILIGDDRQLPPMIGHDTVRDVAEQLGVPERELNHLRRSLFAELWAEAPEEIKTMLQIQYRMHDDIMEVINQFYGGQLQTGLLNSDEERAHGFSMPWLHPSSHVVWFNTPSSDPYRGKEDDKSFYNDKEISAIERILDRLNEQWRTRIAEGEARKQVGVISFYAAQVMRLRARLLDDPRRYDALELRIDSVDRFQGMERPVIIVSMVRNNPDGDIGFAKSPQRVNVALSRAQQLLILVGSTQLFAYDAKDPAARSIYHNVLKKVEAKGEIVDVSTLQLD